MWFICGFSRGLLSDSRNSIIVAGMGLPGGGLYDVPALLTHHFFILHMPKYSNQPMLEILDGLYSQQLQGYLVDCRA